jgi:UDP:flavonoid glycosyltransferase YjiC (YdhE family)
MLLLSREIDPPLNAVRADYGLPPRRRYASDGNMSPYCTIVASSPAFISPPPDWPASVHMTGFCFADSGETWEEPQGLTAVLEGAAPVVALSAGSMVHEVEHLFDSFFRDGIAAIRRAGARALVIGAPGGALPDPLPEDVCALPFAPFSRVYPRCAAVIHHGGIGTTAQALRAGVPALVVPWGVDQFATAVNVANVGAGRWLMHNRFTERRAAKEIRRLLTDETMRARTREIAARIATEDGVAAASNVLERYLATRVSNFAVQANRR